MATQQINVDVPPASKKIKLNEVETFDSNLHDEIKDLSTFQLDNILYNSSQKKVVCLHGRFGEKKENGLVILEKTAFEEKDFKSDGYFTENTILKKLFHNDVYGNYESFPLPELNSIKTTIIHPATEKHIQKYTSQNLYIVNETPELYKNITLPHLLKDQFDLQWVYNILEHKSEQERIIFEDSNPTTGFILLPDLKWNGTTLETLYLLAIVQLCDLKSLRDLTDKHLPLLKNIYEKGCEIIHSKYKLDQTQLRIYVHYQPSFYHFHVHFTYLKHEAPGILAERAHILANVISNIELVSNYYQKVTLPFVIKESETLFAKFEEQGILKKVESIKD